MKKVLIIGCGYGGVTAAWRFSGFRKDIETTVIDRGKYFNFLPLLPDVLGRGIPAQALSYSIEKLASRYAFNFINAEVSSLDLENKRVVMKQESLAYDYVLIASGSQTNFYGNDAVQKYAYALDDARDAQKLRDTLGRETFATYIIAGGGYTGIEIAANLRVYLRKKEKKNRIIIVEKAPAILGPLPEWMRQYTTGNLRRLDIEVFTGTVIEKIEGRDVHISGKGAFQNSMLIWAGGVRTADFLQGLAVEKNPQGRLKVDEFLRVNENCFAIGDASYFSFKNNFLRMAVQFAIAQGSAAAFNILRSIKSRKLKSYRPVDLGYIIPMANNASCGRVLGTNMQGLPATLCHYLMSTYRAYGFKNKLGILKTLLRGGGK